MLDAERFSAKTADKLKLVDERRFASNDDFELPEQERLADGTVIPHVGQPRNVAVRQHIMGRGGHKNLKRIQSIEAHGYIEANGNLTPIVVESKRPNSLRRIIGVGEHMSAAQLHLDGSVNIPVSETRGLPDQFERILLESFEFDGLFVEWPDKGHEVDMLGMRKFGDVLAWQLDLVQNGGRHWQLYIDSHSGNLVRSERLDADGEPIFTIDQSDFKETSGFRFPHRITYTTENEGLLATEVFDRIVVDVEPFELDQDAITH